MDQPQKAEQLPLPEQLYILLVNPTTGEPAFDRRRVERVLATSIVWELFHSQALEAAGDQITGASYVMFQEPYLRQAALLASKMAPIPGPALIALIAAELSPIWRAIGEGMTSKHLVAEDVQNRFWVFHKQVLVELADARRDGAELTEALKQTAQSVWDPTYEAQVGQTHPRLLARIVLLDNYGLLRSVIGRDAYEQVALHLPEIREHARDIPPAVGNVPAPQKPSRSADTSTAYSCYSCGGCGGGWIYDWSHDDGGGGGDHGHGHDQDGQDGDGDGDGGGGDGGGGGGCGGCGGG